jgi:hypothetical protein
MVRLLLAVASSAEIPMPSIFVSQLLLAFAAPQFLASIPNRSVRGRGLRNPREDLRDNYYGTSRGSSAM